MAPLAASLAGLPGVSGFPGLLGPAGLLGVQGVDRGQLAGRLLIALVLTYVIGFEREIRGAAAGDRTFALIGVGSAVVGALALDNAPHALAGVVTGIGFIGAGVILHAGSSGETMVRGVTTAATIYLAAAVGAAAGQGELLLAGVATGTAVFVLEIRHLRVLRFLDGRRYASLARSDERMDGKAHDGPGDA